MSKSKNAESKNEGINEFSSYKMTRLFLITDEKRKISLPRSEENEEYVLKYVISGDDRTEMSIQKFLRDGGMFLKNDVFISFLHKTPLELRISEPLIPRENLVIVSNKKNLEKDLLSFDTVSKDDYDFFGGGELESKNEEVIRSVQKYMKELKNLTHAFIDAGYRDVDRDNYTGKISDWMVTFEDPLQKLFVNYCRPETSAGDMTVEDEFLINPAFRKGITEYFMKIVANFYINNNLTTIEEIAGMGNSKGWYDPGVWEELKTIDISMIEK